MFTHYSLSPLSLSLSLPLSPSLSLSLLPLSPSLPLSLSLPPSLPLSLLSLPPLSLSLSLSPSLSYIFGMHIYLAGGADHAGKCPRSGYPCGTAARGDWVLASFWGSLESGLFRV